MRRFNQNFKDPLMEAGFHLQTDRWLFVISKLQMNSNLILVSRLF